MRGQQHTVARATTETSADKVDEANVAGCCLRVLNGPLRGSTYPVVHRMMIGRAAKVDIQLLDDGVSRQHAHIVIDEQGRPILADLNSSNGTFVQGEKIQRHLLEPGDTFRIMRTKFVYERIAQADSDDDSGIYAVDATGIMSLRATVDYSVMDLPQPVAARLGVQGASESRPTNRPPNGEPLAAARGDERHRVVATGLDGKPYRGSLLDDIINYRHLVVRQRRGESLSSQDADLMAELSQRLRAPQPNPNGGQDPEFVRFTCRRFPAQLRLTDMQEEREIPVIVTALGVDGATLLLQQHKLSFDRVAWLAIDLVSKGLSRTVVFTARIGWIRDEQMGLSFAGEPGWDKPIQHDATQLMRSMPQIKPPEPKRGIRAVIGRLRRLGR